MFPLPVSDRQGTSHFIKFILKIKEVKAYLPKTFSVYIHPLHVLSADVHNPGVFPVHSLFLYRHIQHSNRFHVIPVYSSREIQFRIPARLNHSGAGQPLHKSAMDGKASLCVADSSH